MTLPAPIELTIILPGAITVGAPNQGETYNEHTELQNDAIRLIADALIEYSGLSVVRTINDLQPNAAGNFVIPKTVLVEALTTAQRDTIPVEGRVIGRLVYNTTTRSLEVYGNNGWQVAGNAASTAYSFTRAAGVITSITENRPDGSKRLSVPRYANDRLSSITRYNPSQTDTFTYDSSGYLTGVTTA